MALKDEQLEKIWLLSDTVLYNEAVAFVRALVEEPGYAPLPTNQANGLLNSAAGSDYPQLLQFIKYQGRGRDWGGKKQHIPAFYQGLEERLNRMFKERLRAEFGLVAEKADTQEKNEVMMVLARELIQHLIAENGLVGAEKAKQQAQYKENGKESQHA